MDAIRNHTKAPPIVASRYVQIDQPLAWGYKKLHVLNALRKDLAPPWDVSPKVMSPETLTAAMRFLGRIAHHAIASVERVVWTKQPAIV
jgi:hypothetical protein